jgi:hypothetical protein
MEADYAQEVLTPAIAGFKRGLFGRDDLVLHTADTGLGTRG